MEDLLALITRLNQHADSHADQVVGNPEWSVNADVALLQSQLAAVAIHETAKGMAIIPQVAKELKQVGVDLVVTREGTQTLSIVAYSGFGALVIWWDRDSLMYWMEVHQTAHPAASLELDTTVSYPVVEDNRPFLVRAASSLKQLFVSK